jgi:hypothetical protein
VQFARTDLRKYSFAVRSIEGWNKLSVNARSAASSESSRKRLKGVKERGLNQNEQSDISDDDREWKMKKIKNKNGGSLVLKPRTISDDQWTRTRT